MVDANAVESFLKDKFITSFPVLLHKQADF